MAIYTTINKPGDFFGQKSFTGNGSNGNAITGLGLQPDLLHIKNTESAGNSNIVTHTNIGLPNTLHFDANYQEAASSNKINSFQTDGFTVQGHSTVNENNVKMVAFGWKCNGASNSANDASSTSIGTIDTSNQFNTTSKFGMARYTGTGSNGSIKHGLGDVPSFAWFKEVGADGEEWVIYHHKNTAAPETDYLTMENADTADDATIFNDTAPSSTVMTVGTNTKINGSSQTQQAWIWGTVNGYSKFGRYLGNANANGPFVNTGFTPAYIWIKKTGGADDGAVIHADILTTNNTKNTVLQTASDEAQDVHANYGVNFFHNGFQIVGTYNIINESGVEFVYAAFAKHPLVTAGTSVGHIAKGI